ncbi:MAG: fibrobacter succinogenes major paralogous domain-containing protein [Fibrobacter sp.]|nr:fibrobacter succinogenes major paralogous domain-containing protein [Fibrobacter sp.]
MYLKKILLLPMVLSVALLAACGGEEAKVTGSVDDAADSPIVTSSSFLQSSADESSSSELTGPVSADVPVDMPAESSGAVESSESAKSSGSVKSSSSAKSSESAKISSSSSEKEAVSSSIGTEDIILPNDYNSKMLVKAVPCRNDSTDNCEYGTLTDERDGQTYKTVKIGNLWWMAENLNYAYLQPVADMDSGSFCYNDSLEYCEKYGRLYPWAIALGVCPSGWHLPWYIEYSTMLSGNLTTRGNELKSTEWEGTDGYGFAALPSGARYYGGTYSLSEGFGGMGGGEDPAWFWTDTKVTDERYSVFTYDSVTYEVEIALALKVYTSDGATITTGNVDNAFSVRCVKDWPASP